MAEKKNTTRDASVVKRVSSILDLFSENRPRIDLQDAEDVLQLSQATAYRYLREMHEVGLLSRVGGKYMPGPKMIELEFLISRFDPLIVASRPVISALAQVTGCDILLGRLYNLRIVNVTSALNSRESELNFPPGRTIPLFRGAPARIVLAAMTRRDRRRIFDLGEGDPDRDNIGVDWNAFNATLDGHRKDGFYLSRGELDEDVSGIAAPIIDHSGVVIGSIATVYRNRDTPLLSEGRLIEKTKLAARQITDWIRAHYEDLE